MFRHSGSRRTHRHNMRLASLLCLTAGFVNVSGFLAFAVLTTNVTGHVAAFAEKIANGEFDAARVVGLWMLLFFLGAFFSSLYSFLMSRYERFYHTIPIIIEIIILCLVGFYGATYDKTLIKTEIFAGALLFAMGMQNAMVSMVSGSVVRTTHLTGIFTDLGIDLSALFKKSKHGRPELIKRIGLRLTIVAFFFIGGISGGLLFKSLSYKTFYIPSAILVFAMFYDIFRVRTIRYVRSIGRKIGVQ